MVAVVWILAGLTILLGLGVWRMLVLSRQTKEALVELIETLREVVAKLTSVAEKVTTIAETLEDVTETLEEVNTG